MFGIAAIDRDDLEELRLLNCSALLSKKLGNLAIENGWRWGWGRVRWGRVGRRLFGWWQVLLLVVIEDVLLVSMLSHVGVEVCDEFVAMWGGVGVVLEKLRKEGVKL